MEKQLTFLIISDSHIGECYDYEYENRQPAPYLSRIVASILKRTCQPDFIVHTGDLCGDKNRHASQSAYNLARNILKDINCPIYPVCGNHDDCQLLHENFQNEKRIRWLIRNPTSYVYAFNYGIEHFICLQSSSAEQRMGQINQEQIDVVHSYLDSHSEPVSIFMHHPPIETNSPWINEHMLLGNREQFRQFLQGYQKRIRAVFFGHIHKPFKVEKAGVTYISAASTFLPFHLNSDLKGCVLDPQGVCGFNEVTITNNELSLNFIEIES